MRNKLAAWMEVAKPWSWVAALVPVGVGGALASWGGHWEGWRLAGCVGIAWGLLVAGNFFRAAAENDGAGLKKWELRLAGIFGLAVAAASSAWTVPLERLELWVLGAVAVVAAMTFAAGKDAYGAQGFGEAVVGIFFGPVAVLGTCAVAGRLYSLEGVFFGVAAGALAAAALEVCQLRDAERDAKAGKRTLVVRHGRKLGERIYFGGMLGAATLTAALGAELVWLWGAAVVLLVGGGRLNATLKRAKKDKDFEWVLKQTFLWMGLWGVCVGLAVAAR